MIVDLLSSFQTFSHDASFQSVEAVAVAAVEGFEGSLQLEQNQGSAGCRVIGNMTLLVI
jgi:hypothetical protein